MRRHTEWGQWNDVFVEELLSGQPNTKWQEEQDLADYINKQTTGRVLVDDFEGYRVIFFSGRPERFLTPADSTFNETLHDPAGRVDYIMVSEPILEGQLNAVNKAFPTLYTLGGSWVKLEKTAFRWKLYQVIGSPSQLPATNAAAQPSSP
ncbi:MAG: hypothetical protein HY260_16165 [Chloroflexi bacterium]|nr:hypothetical protein [Chloroflexota bacterium]